MAKGFSVLYLAVIAVAAATNLSSRSGDPITQSGPALQPIPGTNIQMNLPEDWKVESASPGVPPGPILKHLADPKYELQIRQTGPSAPGRSCMSLIGSMKTSFGGAELHPRPSFIPNAYVGTMLEVPEAQLTCLNTGDTMFAVFIFLPVGKSNPQVISGILQQFADAALKQSKAVKGPGPLRLPILAADVPLPNGGWGVQEVAGQSGKNDVIVRQSGGGLNELEIEPRMKSSARCETFMAIPKAHDGSHQTYVHNPTYVGTGWYAVSIEQFPPPLKSLEAYACRNVGKDSILFAKIDYEGEKIEGADELILKQMLSDLGNAADQKQSSR